MIIYLKRGCEIIQRNIGHPYQYDEYRWLKDGKPVRYCLEYTGVSFKGLKQWTNTAYILDREDGPAEIRQDGSKSYFIKGKAYTEEAFNTEIQARKSLNKLFIELAEEIQKRQELKEPSP